VNGVFFSDGLAIVYPVEAPATIVLTVTDQCGNVGEDEMLVSIDPSGLDVSLGPNLTITCLDQVVINPDVEGGDGTITYEWLVDGQNAGSGTTLTLDPDETTTVILTVSDQCGWEQSDEMVINVPAVPILLEVTDDQVLCPGDGVTLEVDATGGVGTLSYEWIPGGSSNTSISISPDESTIYSIMVNDECGNGTTEEIEVAVLVYEPFVVTEDFDICINVQRAGLVSGGQPPYIFTYTGSDITIDDEKLIANSPGNVTVLVEDQCGNSGSFIAHVSGCTTTFPNIFTPNDDSENQNFEIIGLDGYPGSTLRVFNRWGNLVYENDNYKNNWDGSESPSGTYYYTFDRVDGEQFNGYVTLLKDN
jgi:gliding motility-associated-like protein